MLFYYSYFDAHFGAIHDNPTSQHISLFVLIHDSVKKHFHTLLTLAYDNTCKYLAETYPAEFALFSEEVMQESVIYQSIVQKEALRLIDRQLTRRFGDIPPEIEQRLRRLSTADLENLGEALLDFSNTNDLIVWLENNS